MRDQPIARQVPVQRNVTRKTSDRTYIHASSGIRSRVSIFECCKTVRALDSATNLMDEPKIKCTVLPILYMGVELC